MKISNPRTYNRLMLLVWAFLWLNLVTQYWAVMPLPIAVSISVVFLLCAYPFVTYLSDKLLTKAARTAKWRAFAFKFLGVSIICGTVLFGCVMFFAYLEKIGVFKSSYFYEDYLFVLHDLINAMLAAIMINFGFCGLRFIEINIRLQRELHESQLQTLKGQINPHSMFNVLNHIHVLLEKDPVAADDLLLNYSDILRYQLYNASKETVSLKQEIHYMKLYIAVEKIRWKNKITVTERWEYDNEDLRITPLLFVTFLENAFKYVARSDAENGYVYVNFMEAEGRISFMVKNSKSTIRIEKKEETGLGLPNIRKRLNILYPSRHKLFISESDNDYCVSLTLNI